MMTRKYQRNNGRKGRAPFTLIEVVVVIVILVSLASLATPLYMDYVKRGKKGTAISQIKLLEEALNTYQLDVGAYPSELRGLVENIDQSDKWAGPYIKPKVPLDPWNNDYVYTTPGEHNSDFDLSSYGADGASGGEGYNADITNWQ